MNDNRLDRISVIVCTCKQQFISRIFDNFLRQNLNKRKQLFTNRFTSWIAGGSLSFSIDVYKKIQFADCSLGEDRQFLLDSRRI